MMSQQPHILIADDERSIRLMLETGLTLNGFRVTSVRNGQEALTATQGEKFDAILSDIYMPDLGGLELVDALRAADPGLPIVLMTAQGSLQVAVDAVTRGATDFIGKPFDIAAVVDLLKRLLEARREAEAVSVAEPENQLAHAGLVGRSAPMIVVYKLIAQAARSDATVLILGESGTGKELVARAIHDFSARRGRPFLSVNCSGLTDTLLEAELFGHTRGAFTGATGDRAGLFEAADGGTLFLDELASTSQAFQQSLLRVLQSGEVRRVGATQSRRFNVRVIGASNAPLRDLVAAGNFRADLFYRLSVLSVELPPLRERTGDIELLTSHFLQRFREPGDAPLHLTREAAEALAAHKFPGNVRELENALRRAVALSAGGVVTIDCLPSEIAARRSKPVAVERPEQRLIADRPNMEELQRRYLQLILEETGWNRRRAAAVLDLDRRTIQRLIARYQLHGAVDPEGEVELETDADASERPPERTMDIV
jgi:DNA-binding NtrC family response regulator